MYKIAVIPGDGTGPEVVNEGLKVLEAAGKKYKFQYETKTFDFGGERYLKTGKTLEDKDIEELKKYSAIFLGAIGHPKAEFLMPAIADELIRERKITMRVLETPEKWFGVTYKEDKPFVTAGIRRLIEHGVYPQKLWA